MSYKILIKFNNLSDALEYAGNSSINYRYLYKVFKYYYLFIEPYDIKDLSHLLKKDSPDE